MFKYSGNDDAALMGILAVLGSVLVILILYWMYRTYIGQNISAFNPVESNVDRYLDMRFEKLIDEWGLVTGSQLKGFKKRVDTRMDADIKHLKKLKDNKSSLNNKLDNFEKRATVLEK